MIYLIYFKKISNNKKLPFILFFNGEIIQHVTCIQSCFSTKTPQSKWDRKDRKVAEKEKPPPPSSIPALPLESTPAVAQLGQFQVRRSFALLEIVLLSPLCEKNAFRMTELQLRAPEMLLSAVSGIHRFSLPRVAFDQFELVLSMRFDFVLDNLVWDLDLGRCSFSDLINIRSKLGQIVRPGRSRSW